MKKRRLDTLEQAERAFYDAFEAADLEAMMAAWSLDHDIVCIHPHGPRLVGPVEVREGWRQILGHSPRMTFSISELNTIQGDDLAVRLVTENILMDDEARTEFIVLATNVYRRSAEGWHLILHHASPSPESIVETETSEEERDGDDVTIH